MAEINASNWFMDKVLPPALLVLVTSIGGASWTIWNNLNELKTLVVNQDKEIQTIKSMQLQLVAKSELDSTIKNLKQQIEIGMLRSKIPHKTNSKVYEEEFKLFGLDEKAYEKH